MSLKIEDGMKYLIYAESDRKKKKKKRARAQTTAKDDGQTSWISKACIYT